MPIHEHSGPGSLSTDSPQDPINPNPISITPSGGLVSTTHGVICAVATRRTGEEEEELCHSSLRVRQSAMPINASIFTGHHIMQTATNLQPGKPAPDFTAPITSGEIIRLSNYRGKQVVLYFYPKDDTPGCTVEACGLRDHYHKIRELGAEVLGVSIDDVESHRRFTEKFNIPFPLVADADAKITMTYGVYNEKWKMARRVTFLIDDQGNIAHIFDPVKPDVHPKEVLDALKA